MEKSAQFALVNQIRRGTERTARASTESAVTAKTVQFVLVTQVHQGTEKTVQSALVLWAYQMH